MELIVRATMEVEEKGEEKIEVKKERRRNREGEEKEVMRRLYLVF